MLETESLHPSELTEIDAKAWRDLVVANPAFRSPLLGPDFARAVGAVRPDARVTVFRRDGRSVGFLPHHQRPGGLARPIGAVLSDFHALVSAPGAGLTGPEALAKAGLSSFRFSGLIDPHGLFDANATRESHSVEPGGDVEAYLETLRAVSAKRFKNWRRLENKLDREVGPLRLVAADLSQAAFDTLLAWKRDQLHRTGGHDFLRPVWTGQLLANLFAEREGDFRGLMICLYAGDRLVAGHFGVRQGGVYHPWIASTDPELAAWSPGQAFLAQAIAAMPGLGLDRYDLGPGHDHYKRPWALTQTPIGEGVALAGSPAGRRAASLEGAWVLAGARRGGAVGRLHRRLDAIASVETTMGGRVRGLIDAVAAQARKGQGAEG
jgi:CelD/BcsL family acetyltransferase involved in cellulose biosynthesis